MPVISLSDKPPTTAKTASERYFRSINFENKGPNPKGGVYQVEQVARVLPCSERPGRSFFS